MRTLEAWRTDDTALFDFSDGEIRIDVKTAGGKARIHTFSYEQCNAPLGALAVAASLLVERASGGVSLITLIDEIVGRIAAHSDLVLKLHEVVAATVGADLNEALAQRFDLQLADSSLRFFNLREIPAIREPLTPGVSEVHFRSDLSNVSPLSVQSLIDRDAHFWDFLPDECNGRGGARVRESKL